MLPKLREYVEHLTYKSYDTIPWQGGNDLPTGIVLRYSAGVRSNIYPYAPLTCASPIKYAYVIVGDKTAGVGWMPFSYDGAVIWTFWIPSDAEWAWIYDND